MILAFDSDVSTGVLRGHNALITDRYLATDPETIVLPSIVAGELTVGALKSRRPNAMAELEEFLTRHAIVPFGEAEFRVYARIRAYLETNGMKIGPNDLIVAATALAAGATLVTHNVREFARVPGLSLVDWQV